MEEASDTGLWTLRGRVGGERSDRVLKRLSLEDRGIKSPERVEVHLAPGINLDDDAKHNNIRYNVRPWQQVDSYAEYTDSRTSKPRLVFETVHSSGYPVSPSPSIGVMGYRVVEGYKYHKSDELATVTSTEGPFTMEEFRAKFKHTLKDSPTKSTLPAEIGQDATALGKSYPPRQMKVVDRVEDRPKPFYPAKVFVEERGAQMHYVERSSTFSMPTSRVAYKNIDGQRIDIQSRGHTNLTSSIPRSDSPQKYGDHDHTVRSGFPVSAVEQYYNPHATYAQSSYASSTGVGLYSSTRSNTSYYSTQSTPIYSSTSSHSKKIIA